MPFYKVEIKFNGTEEDSGLYLTIRAEDGYAAVEHAREVFPTAFSITAERFRD